MAGTDTSNSVRDPEDRVIEAKGRLCMVGHMLQQTINAPNEWDPNHLYTLGIMIEEYAEQLAAAFYERHQP